jgi:hypothetical protein
MVVATGASLMLWLRDAARWRVALHAQPACALLAWLLLFVDESAADAHLMRWVRLAAASMLC